MPNHDDIQLDDLLADAASHLKDCDMLALSRAVEIARARLMGLDEGEMPTVPAPEEQLTLSVVR